MFRKISATTAERRDYRRVSPAVGGTRCAVVKRIFCRCPRSARRLLYLAGGAGASPALANPMVSIGGDIFCCRYQLGLAIERPSRISAFLAPDNLPHCPLRRPIRGQLFPELGLALDSIPQPRRASSRSLRQRESTMRSGMPLWPANGVTDRPWGASAVLFRLRIQPPHDFGLCLDLRTLGHPQHVALHRNAVVNQSPDVKQWADMAFAVRNYS